MVHIWNKCIECGKFVSYKDIENGDATNILIEPDNEFGDERFECLCPKHVTKQESINV